MTINFNKTNDGLIPAIIQDAATKTVLMLGYMNQEAFDQTEKSGKVTFYSRSKKRLWTKGEESGNFLNVVSIKNDCDHDTLLIRVKPDGPTCHTGSDTCWNEKNEKADLGFISELENVIAQRKSLAQDTTEEKDSSYVASLFRKGINKVAQKVGEEAVEVVIEAKDDNDDLFLNESADLLFHYLILLQAKDYKIDDVVRILRSRS